MEVLSAHFGELMIGIVLTVFAWAFKSWSGAIQGSTKEIMQQFTTMMADFHLHKLESERRITKLETQLEDLERRVTKTGNGRVT